MNNSEISTDLMEDAILRTVVPNKEWREKLIAKAGKGSALLNADVRRFFRSNDVRNIARLIAISLNEINVEKRTRTGAPSYPGFSPQPGEKCFMVEVKEDITETHSVQIYAPDPLTAAQRGLDVFMNTAEEEMEFKAISFDTSGVTGRDVYVTPEEDSRTQFNYYGVDTDVTEDHLGT